MAEAKVKFSAEADGLLSVVKNVSQSLEGVDTDSVKFKSTLADLAKQVGLTEDESKALEKALIDAKKAMDDDPARKLKAALDGVNQEQKQATTSSNDLGNALKDVGDIFKAVGEWGKSAFEAVSESIKRAAENGDESSKIIVGAFTKIQESGDGVSSIFAKSMAPAMTSLVSGFKELSDEAKKWIETNDVGRESVITFMTVVLGLVQSLHTLYDGYKFVEQAINGVGAALDQIKEKKATDDLSNAAENLTENLGLTTSQVDELNKSLENVAQKNARINEQNDAFIQLESTISSIIEKMDTERDPDKSLGISKEDIEKKNQELEKIAKDAAEKQKQLAEKTLQEKQAMLAVDFENEIKLAGDSNTKKLEVLQKYHDEFFVLHVAEKDKLHQYDLEQAALELQIADDLATQVEERVLRQSEIQEEAKLKEIELNDEQLQARIEQINLETISEEEKTNKILAYAQMEAEAARMVALSTSESLQVREAARKKFMAAEGVVQTQGKKLRDKTITEEKEAATIIANLAVSTASILLDTNKSWSEKMQAIGANLTSTIIGEFQKRAAAAIVNSLTEKNSALSVIPAKVAAAVSHMGIAAPIIAAGLIAALMALAVKKSLADGGTVPGAKSDGMADGGTIPGMGFQDSVPMFGAVMPGEEVITRPVADAPGMRSVLKKINSGMNPAVAAASSGFGGVAQGQGSMTMRVVVEGRQDALIRAIADALSVYVVNDDGYLVASHVAQA